MLLSCLRADDPTKPSDELRALTDSADRGELVATAVRHRLAGLVHLQQRSLGWAPDDGADQLRSSYLATIAGHLRLSAELRDVGSVLESAGVPWLSFKGPVLVAQVYPRPDLRAYGDIDVLVPAAGLPTALDALHAHGASMLSEPWSVLQRTERAQLSIVTRRGAALDLHWNVSNGPASRAVFPVSTAELLAERVAVTVNGVPVWALSEADALVHLALHGAMSGGERLIWSYDLHLMAQQITDWDAVVVRARTSRTGLVVAVMLGRAQRLLGTPLPEGLLDTLSAAHLWRGVVAMLDRHRPPQNSLLGTGRVIMTSTRHASGDSSRHLLTSAYREALVPMLFVDDHPWRVAARKGVRRSQGGSPDITPHDIGPQAAGRDAFLEWVTTTDRG